MNAVEPDAPVLLKVSSSPLNAVAVEAMTRAVPEVRALADIPTALPVVIESPRSEMASPPVALAVERVIFSAVSVVLILM